MGKLIAIASAKGGVGKTTILLNLGTALTLFGKNTLILDANLETPALSLHLGVAHISPTISEVLTNETPLSEAIFQHQSGLNVIAANLTSTVENPEWDNVLPKLKQTADLILIDTPTSINNNILKKVDDAILVTSPDLPAVAATLKTAKKLRNENINIIGTIINRCSNDNTEMSQFDIKQMLNTAIIGFVPDDKKLKKSLKIAHPLVYTDPDSPASISFKKIAANLLGQTYKINLKQEKPWYKWLT